MNFPLLLAPIALAGVDRLAEKVAVQIVCECFNRGVASIRLLAHRHGDNCVQVAAQARTQPLRREPAAIRIRLRSSSFSPFSFEITIWLGRTGSSMQMARSSCSWL